MKSAVVDFGIQWACFAVAAALKTEKFFDLAGECHFFFLKSTLRVTVSVTGVRHPLTEEQTPPLLAQIPDNEIGK